MYPYNSLNPTIVEHLSFLSSHTGKPIMLLIFSLFGSTPLACDPGTLIGLFQKKTNRELRTYCFENPPEFFRFFTLLLEIPDKTSLHS